MEMYITSPISLKIKNKNIEYSFWQEIVKDFGKWRCYLSILSLIISIGNLVFQTSFKNQIRNLSNSCLTSLSIFEISARCLILFLTNFMKNINHRFWLNLLNYFLLTILFYSLQLGVYFSLFTQNSDSHLVIMIFETIIRILYLFTGVIGFISSSIIHLLSLILTLMTSMVLNNGILNQYLFGFSFYYLCNSFISYLIDFHRKNLFYFKYQLESLKNLERTKNDKINSGILWVRPNKIEYYNIWMKEMIHNMIITNSNILKKSNKELDINENSEFVLNELFSDIKYNNTSDNSVISVKEEAKLIGACKVPETQSNFLTSFFDKIKNDFIINSDQFILIGFKIITQDRDEYHYEIHCRKRDEFFNDRYEIIINQINRNNSYNSHSIKSENIGKENFISNTNISNNNNSNNVEGYINPLFLAKIAHEFKNPLICVIELVNQLSDNLKCAKKQQPNKSSSLSISYNKKIDSPLEKEVRENLNQINALSNYLLILIKDFDVFSQNIIQNTLNNIQIDLKECSVEEIVLFCKDIGIALLKKNEKIEEINLEIEICKDVPSKITTDEFKIKQVLINLLSNAIKFTTEGKILLSVQKQDKEITFSVEDTGIGIKENLQKRLFIPYDKNLNEKNVKNTLGAGLGLSIIKDITGALGKEIEFISIPNKGSKFWFSLINENLSTNDLVSKKRTNIRYVTYKSYLLQDNNKKIKDLQSSKILCDDISEIKFKIKSNSHDSQASGRSAGSGGSDSHCSSEDVSISEDAENFESEIPTIEREVTLTLDKKNFMIKGDKIIFTGKDRTESSYDTSKYLLTVNSRPRTSFPTLKTPFFKFKIDEESEQNEKNEIDLGIMKLTNGKENWSTISNNLPINSKVASDQADSGIIFNVGEIINTSFKRLKTRNESIIQNIIIVDDEKLSRMSTRRMIKTYCDEKNLPINILEAEDGIECLYLVYNCIKKAIDISFILSDQTMNFLNGSFTATILKEFCNNQKLKEIPFFLVTAFEDMNVLKDLNSCPVNETFTKPLNRKCTEKLFAFYLQ